MLYVTCYITRHILHIASFICLTYDIFWHVAYDMWHITYYIFAIHVVSYIYTHILHNYIIQVWYLYIMCIVHWIQIYHVSYIHIYIYSIQTSWHWMTSGNASRVFGRANLCQRHKSWRWSTATALPIGCLEKAVASFAQKRSWLALESASVLANSSFQLIKGLTMLIYTQLGQLNWMSCFFPSHESSQVVLSPFILWPRSSTVRWDLGRIRFLSCNGRLAINKLTGATKMFKTHSKKKMNRKKRYFRKGIKFTHPTWFTSYPLGCMLHQIHFNKPKSTSLLGSAKYLGLPMLSTSHCSKKKHGTSMSNTSGIKGIDFFLVGSVNHLKLQFFQIILKPLKRNIGT